ncbi:polysaccharide pyruvyl transferase family protein, partial [Streptococcus suis]
GRELAKKTFPNTVEYVSEDTPENFLSVYREAKYIITDSFHGTVFATIFQKPFSIFYNEQRGIDRFNSLMKLFELGETRRVYEQNTKQEIEENKNI